MLAIVAHAVELSMERSQVFGKAAAPAEPGEGAFDHPAARQKHEALCGIGALDDLQGPAAMPFERVPEFVACISVQAMCFSYRLDNDSELQPTDIPKYLFARTLSSLLKNP